MIRTSLRVKLVRTMIATLVIIASATISVVVVMNIVASNKALERIETRLRASIDDKGTGLVTSQSLALRGLVSDNAFNDVGQLIERSVAKDPDLVFGLFVDQDGKPWTFNANKNVPSFPKDWKALGIDVAAARQAGVQIAHKDVGGEGLFQFLVPVTEDKGEPLGILAYGLSDRPLRTAVAEARTDSRKTLGVTVVMLLFLGGITSILGVVLSRRSATRITQPVSDLTKAVKDLAGGQREIRVQINSGDELETLGGAFNQMAADLAESYGRLEGMNRTLEQRVEERTRELGQRNRDMRLVLDNVNQGFLTLSRDGTLAIERSKIVDTWFGEFGPATKFAEYIGRVDAMYGASFGIGLDAIIDDFMPLELCMDQLPARLRGGGREFRCTYRSIMKGDKFDGLLVVVNDVTEELLHSRQEAERKEILAMFEGVTKDRMGFLSFMEEATDQLSQLAEGDVQTQKRLLHTLKGNSSMVGFATVAQLSHAMEDTIEEIERPLSADLLKPLTDRWQQLDQSLKAFVGDKGRDVIELRSSEIERVIELVKMGAPAAGVLDRLASWWLEPADRSLRRLGNYAVALSRRLGKGDLELEIASNGIRLAPKAWSGFWTDLVHVVRNAVDHGLETPSERTAANKPGGGHLRLSSKVEKGRLVVEIEDNGRGIDWDAIRAVAIRKGLPHKTQEDLTKAVFASGVSSRTEVTSLSGRGVGLSAVMQQVQDLGGTVSIETEASKGCCFRFAFPMPGIGPRFGIDVDPERPSMSAVA